MLVGEAMIKLRDRGVIPCSAERPPAKPSNSELRRWAKKGSILIINGVSNRETRPSWGEAVPDDAHTLIFFPRGSPCTMPFPWGPLTRP